MPTLRLPAGPRRELESLVRQGYPHETCGLLVGRRDRGGAAVERIVPARNLNQERPGDRYELDPEDFLKADCAARREKLEIIGIWHAHPDHPAEPSETDRLQAWPDWSYIIVSVGRKAVQDIRSWRLEGEHFVEESITA